MKASLVSLLVIGVIGAALCGCQTAAKGPSDQELLNKVVADWKTAAIAKDLDKLMPLYSEKFNHFEYGDKAGLKSYIKDAIDMGYLENATVNADGAKIVIEKDKANAYPIDLKASFGNASIRLNFTKEAAGWMISGMDVEMM
jgi:hypothetical protein